MMAFFLIYIWIDELLIIFYSVISAQIQAEKSDYTPAAISVSQRWIQVCEGAKVAPLVAPATERVLNIYTSGIWIYSEFS